MWRPNVLWDHLYWNPQSFRKVQPASWRSPIALPAIAGHVLNMTFVRPMRLVCAGAATISQLGDVAGGEIVSSSIPRR